MLTRDGRCRKNWLTVLATMVLAAAPGLAQPPSASIQVQVWRDGSPLRGLSASSFEVRENGKRVRVTGVREIDLAAATGGTPDLAPEHRRHLWLLFDLPALSDGAVAAGTAAARDLIASAVRPADRISLALHRGGGRVELKVAPTADRRALLDGLAVVAERSSQRTAEERPAAAAPVVTADRALAAAESGRETDIGIVQQRQGEIHALLRALSRLVELSRPVSGETAVVLFSRGFDSSVVLGDPGTRGRDWAFLGDASEAAARGETWRVNTATRFGGGMVENALLVTLEEYRRTGRAIHAFDLGADPQSGYGPDGLRLLANRTGGSITDSAGALTAAVSAALGPTAVSYLVTFEPGKPRRRGYRRLDVSLEPSLGRLAVRHAPGYYRPAGER